MLEVRGQRGQTSTNQLVPGEVQVVQLREKLEQRRWGADLNSGLEVNCVKRPGTPGDPLKCQFTYPP